MEEREGGRERERGRLQRERERERIIFISRMMVLDRGLIFQYAHNNDTIITLQFTEKNRHYRFSIKVYTQRVNSTSKDN